MALYEPYLAREKRVSSLEFEVQFLLQQNQAQRQNATRFKTDLSLCTTKVASLATRQACLDSRATVTPAKPSAVTGKHAPYHLLKSFLTHHFDFLGTSFGLVDAEAHYRCANIY